MSASKIQTRPGTEPVAVRGLLIGVAVLFITIFIVIPLITVFGQAFAKGLSVYLSSIGNTDTVAAIRLTGLVVLIVVPLNIVFGIAASWLFSKFDFWGKNVLITLIDLPFAVSPVIAGLVFVMVFGLNGWLGPWLLAHNIKIIFGVPGIILATTFVTFPIIARELIPAMQAIGVEEEEAAILLGANGWQTFLRVTLPNIKWGLMYGIILCCVRTMGEFGAVSVVSGHIRGLTNTIPLQVEILYNEYNFAGAFAVASILAMTALLTLVVQFVLEKKLGRHDEFKVDIFKH